MLEIERKFLVKKLPELSNYSFSEITQSYISFNPEVRIRKNGEKSFITFKAEGTSVREEIEVEIESTVYKILSSIVKGNIIKKTRYQIPLPNGFKAELDIYNGNLKGLIIVEVEFSSKKQMKAFTAPDWFGKEITSDKKYKNKNLAKEL